MTKTSITNRAVSYRSVSIDLFREPQSQCWFYCFGFEWVIYRSKQGFASYSDAREAAENHVDLALKN